MNDRAALTDYATPPSSPPLANMCEIGGLGRHVKLFLANQRLWDLVSHATTL